MSKLDIINNITQRLKAISKDTKIPSEIHSFFSKKVVVLLWPLTTIPTKYLFIFPPVKTTTPHQRFLPPFQSHLLAAASSATFGRG